MLAQNRRCPKGHITTKCLHFGDNILQVVINAVGAHGVRILSLKQQQQQITHSASLRAGSLGMTTRKAAAITYREVWIMVRLDAWLACGVVLSTAATDAVYVMFNSAVSSQRRVPAATWSSVWYLLSAFAVISYTKNWVYVCFAAVGSWIGAYISMTVLQRAKGRSAPGAV
jgi:hypothetical protein